VARRHGAVVAARLVIASLVVTVAVQWPLRARQVAGFVKPFAAASQFIARSAAQVVVVPSTRVWYGPDLVRNGPELQPPVVVMQSLRGVNAQRDWLRAHAPGGVRRVTSSELAKLGLAADTGAD
jgi:hypothetical protein